MAHVGNGAPVEEEEEEVGCDQPSRPSKRLRMIPANYSLPLLADMHTTHRSAASFSAFDVIINISIFFFPVLRV